MKKKERKKEPLAIHSRAGSLGRPIRTVYRGTYPSFQHRLRHDAAKARHNPADHTKMKEAQKERGEISRIHPQCTGPMKQ